jgi:The GLUG motif
MKAAAAIMLLSLAAVGPAHAALVVSNGQTRNLSCVGGVCTATARNAVLNTADLETRMASGNLTLATGTRARDIIIAAPAAYASNNRLTLDARYSIVFKAPIQVQGQGALTLTTDDGGEGGELSFQNSGHVEFWDLGDSLVVNGLGYTLAGSPAGIAAMVSADPEGDYALAKSYDASADGAYAASPVAADFRGNFEGLGNRISRLKIDVRGQHLNADIGFFADLAPGATVRNLDIANVDIFVRATHGSISEGVGAVVGSSQGFLDGDAASGKINATIASGYAVGGLVGDVGNNGAIRNSRAAVTVQYQTNKGEGFAGGLVGAIDQGEIAGCSATGDVTVSAVKYGSAAGGLVGAGTSLIITGSWASGAVTASSDGQLGEAGGLIGFLDFGYSIADSYALGNATVVTATQQELAGGLAGETYGTSVATSYSTGASSTAGAGASQFSGGFIAVANGDLASNYWDMDSSGTTQGTAMGNVSGITGLSDMALKSALPSGFDPSVWAQSPGINNGYPYLIANPPQ